MKPEQTRPHRRRRPASGILWALILMVSASACTFAAKEPRRLRSVREAVSHPEAESFIFTGTAMTRYMGAYTWRNPAYRRPFGSEGNPDPFAIWVVPVADVSGDDAGPVAMWVTLVIPGRNIRNLEDRPANWFEMLRTAFNGKEVKAKVMVRAGEGRGSGWEKAVRNAETKHGLKSDPLAPVVAWPPPEDLRGAASFRY